MDQNIINQDFFKEMRTKFEHTLTTEHKLIPEKRMEYISNSGKYKLVVDVLESPISSVRNCTVGNIYKEDKHINTVYRNHPKFNYLWIENHVNGHDYLLCGLDIQGQTVIELDTEKRFDFIPQDAIYGKAPCWIYYCASPNGTRLLVESCYIGGSIMTTVVDFSNPMQGNWEHIGYLENDQEFINDETLNECVRQWISNDHVEVRYTIAVRKSDGKRVFLLKESDLQKLKEDDIELREFISYWSASVITT